MPLRGKLSREITSWGTKTRSVGNPTLRVLVPQLVTPSLCYWCRWTESWHLCGTSSASQVTRCQQSSGFSDECTLITRRPSTWWRCPSATCYFCYCTLSRLETPQPTTQTIQLIVGRIICRWFSNYICYCYDAIVSASSSSSSSICTTYAESFHFLD